MPKRTTRRTHSPQFKFRVALEAAKGVQSINEIAARHKLHPGQVTAWKKELEAGGSSLFERKNARNEELKDQEVRTAELERTLGQVVVEREFLIKKCKQLGIDP
jgi:transposase-like protein